VGGAGGGGAGGGLGSYDPILGQWVDEEGNPYDENGESIKGERVNTPASRAAFRRAQYLERVGRAGISPADRRRFYRQEGHIEMRPAVEAQRRLVRKREVDKEVTRHKASLAAKEAARSGGVIEMAGGGRVIMGLPGGIPEEEDADQALVMASAAGGRIARGHRAPDYSQTIFGPNVDISRQRPEDFERYAADRRHKRQMTIENYNTVRALVREGKLDVDDPRWTRAKQDYMVAIGERESSYAADFNRDYRKKQRAGAGEAPVRGREPGLAVVPGRGMTKADIGAAPEGFGSMSRYLTKGIRTGFELGSGAGLEGGIPQLTVQPEGEEKGEKKLEEIGDKQLATLTTMLGDLQKQGASLQELVVLQRDMKKILVAESN
jgi:hypothetical protein